MPRFEFVEGASSKFWEIELHGASFTARWGRIGTAGQSKPQSFESAAAAKKEYDKLISSKVKKGYELVGPAAPAPAPAAAARTVLTVRLETSESDPRRWRELVLDGQTLKQTVGMEGSEEPPEVSREKHDSRAEASEMLERLVFVYRKRGFVEVSRRSEERGEDEHPERVRARTVENPDLEAACLKAPDSPEPWSVYADWLQSQGDVRGELAALLARGNELEAKALSSRHGEALWGDALEAVERGSVKDLVAQHGFYRRAGLHIDSESNRALDELTRDFLARPVTRFVTSLRFGLAHYESNNDWGPTMEALTSSPRAAELRELRFDDYTYQECEISWTPLGDLSSFWSALPSLEVLHLKSGAGGVLGELMLPRLKTFIRESGGLSAAELESIVTATWPQLEWLEVWTGSGNYGAQATVELLEPVLAAKGLPKLKRLGLVNSELSTQLIASLADSKVLRQLEVLDLSRGVLVDADVDDLLRHARAYRHLKELNLSSNLLEERLDELKRVFPQANLADQRQHEGDDDEDRYVAVGE